ncbi:hypothetical protein, partial [Paracraurococcus ruber]
IICFPIFDLVHAAHHRSGFALGKRVSRETGCSSRIIGAERFRAMIGPDVMPTPMTPDEFATFVHRGRERVTGIVRERNLPIN